MKNIFGFSYKKQLFYNFTARIIEDTSMKAIEFQKTYKTPKVKVVEVNTMGVLCNSQEAFGSSSTEQLQEKDVSRSIWDNN